MSKMSTSLAIVVALHLSILIGSSFFLTKKQVPIFSDTKRSIDLRIGSSLSNSSLKKEGARTHTARTSTSFSKTQGEGESGQFHDSSADNGNGDTITSYEFGDSVVRYKEPIYPRLAIRREIQGSVRLQVKVSLAGKPIDTIVLKSSGHELLDNAALEAVSDWQFQVKNSLYFVEKTIIFQLKN